MSDLVIHYGVKGQKWGVRKADEIAFRKPLKNGGELIATKDPPKGLAKLFSKVSATYRENQTKLHNFTLRNSEGRKVGDASFFEDSPTSLNLMWIGVKGRDRGNGYASAAIDGVVKYAKDKGLKKLTLEVPGNSDDALHIYEKVGFKKTSQLTSAEVDPFWGGLTVMELNLSEVNLKHSSLDVEVLMEYVIESIDSLEIIHYGVKGMKWGVTRSKAVLATGGAAGALGGAAIAKYATNKAARALRSKALSKTMATKVLKASDMGRLTSAVAKPFVAKKILKKNQKLADLITTPKTAATIAVGGAVVAGLLGVGTAAITNKVIDRSTKKSKE